MTVAQQIQYAKIAQYLVVKDLSNGVLFGEPLDVQLPITIYNERKAVEWMYLLNPNEANLVGNGNYLYSLLGKYGIEAQYISGTGGSGGGISPINPNLLPDPLDFEVSLTSPILQGENTLNLASRGYKGFNILFFIGHIQQSKVDEGDGSAYYSWDKNTAILTLINRVAQTGDIFTIYPVV